MAGGFLLSEAATAIALIIFAAHHLAVPVGPFVRDQLNLLAGVKALTNLAKQNRHRISAFRLKLRWEKRA
jgi:hypothetical protein